MPSNTVCIFHIIYILISEQEPFTCTSSSRFTALFTTVANMFSGQNNIRPVTLLLCMPTATERYNMFMPIWLSCMVVHCVMSRFQRRAVQESSSWSETCLHLDVILNLDDMTQTCWTCNCSVRFFRQMAGWDGPDHADHMKLQANTHTHTDTEWYLKKVGHIVSAWRSVVQVCAPMCSGKFQRRPFDTNSPAVRIACLTEKILRIFAARQCIWHLVLRTACLIVLYSLYNFEHLWTKCSQAWLTDIFARF